jgi:hypothetical protein
MRWRTHCWCSEVEGSRAGSSGGGIESECGDLSACAWQSRRLPEIEVHDRMLRRSEKCCEYGEVAGVFETGGGEEEEEEEEEEEGMTVTRQRRRKRQQDKALDDNFTNQQTV